MPQKTVLEAIHDGLLEEMRQDDRVMILGEDVGVHGGVFRVTEGLYKEFGELRALDTPLAESLIVGVAIGAAINGMRPVAEIQFADFIWPAMDQIVSEAAKMRYRSNGDFGVPMVIRAPYGGGVHGALYHSQSIEATFAHVAGLKVVAPATPYDAKGLLRAAIRDPDPVLYLEHKRSYRLIRGEVPDGDYVVPIGTAEVRRQGADLTVLAYGMMLHFALEAAEKLAAEDGVQAEVVDVRSLQPLDKDTILTSVRKTGKALIVHEDCRFVGYGAELAAIIAEEAFDRLDGPVMRITGPDLPAMPFSPPMEEFFLVNPEKILAGMRQLARY
jgi:2-oxoisovalerate dehydrogenase E1 component beta subunit